MTHDAELMAAAYVFGELAPDDRQRFEEHLLECEECWDEVEDARPGRQALESTREFAPAHLRDKIRDAARAPTASGRRRPGVRRPILVAAAAIIIAGTSLSVWSTAQRPSVPTAIAAAVDGYMKSRLPGAATPDTPAPELVGLKLTAIGAGAGRIESYPVNAYAYRDRSGRRLMVYIGERMFPMPDGAQRLEGTDGPWIAHHNGVAVLCARYPHELLIVGKDDELVRAAAESLDVT